MMPELTDREQAELREYARRIRERDEADGLIPRRETVPVYVAQIAEDRHITEAAAEADAAKVRIDARIKKLPGEGAECDRRFTLHLRRSLDPDVDASEGVEDLFFTAFCGCQSCAHCWRRRQVRSIHRAACAILDDNEPDIFEVCIGESGERRVFTTEKAARQARREQYQLGRAARVERVRGRLRPRANALYVGKTTWKKWEESYRAIRRQLPAGTGGTRIRRGDDTVLVVMERPFDGCRCVTPAEAALMTTAAIERMHRGRHAFRLLGAWNDRKPTTWELVAKLPVVLDPVSVEKHVAAIGSNAKRLGALPGFLVRSASLAEAMILGQIAERSILKTLTVSEENGSIRPKFLGVVGGDGFAPAQAGIPDGFDPGGNPWRT